MEKPQPWTPDEPHIADLDPTVVRIADGRVNIRIEEPGPAYFNPGDLITALAETHVSTITGNVQTVAAWMPMSKAAIADEAQWAASMELVVRRLRRFAFNVRKDPNPMPNLDQALFPITSRAAVIAGTGLGYILDAHRTIRGARARARDAWAVLRGTERLYDPDLDY